nr:hypothetical protein [Tanacetum cinerariifolium]
KKLIITEDTVREALRLDDAESIDCLPNEEIFTELARMGYEKPSTKLTFYKAFFLAKWKAQVGDLSSYTIKYSSPALTQKIFANMRRVGKGFSEVETPLFEVVTTPTPSPIAQTSSPPQQQQPSQPTTISMDLLNNLLETYTALTRRVKNLEQDKIAQALEILKLKKRVRKLEKKKKLTVGCIQIVGIIADLDADKNVTLEEVDVEKNAEVEKDADVQGMLEESQAKVYHIDLKHAYKVLITVATTTITTVAASITAATITAAPNAARRRKGVVIRDPEETATLSTIIHSEPKSKDKGKRIMVEDPKPLKKQAQIEQDEAYARELEAELNRNIN